MESRFIEIWFRHWLCSRLVLYIVFTMLIESNEFSPFRIFESGAQFTQSRHGHCSWALCARILDYARFSEWFDSLLRLFSIHFPLPVRAESIPRRRLHRPSSLPELMLSLSTLLATIWVEWKSATLPSPIFKPVHFTSEIRARRRQSKEMCGKSQSKT